MKLLQKNVRRGKFKQRVIQKSGSISEEDDKRVDPALTRQILERYLASPVRLEALSQPDDLDEEILSTEILVRSEGARIDVIRNLTVRNIVHKKECVVQCPYCHSNVAWSSHKTVCAKRALSESHDQDLSDKIYYRISVKNHKTR